MVNLGCQDKDWVEGNEKEVLDAILLQNGFILVKSCTPHPREKSGPSNKGDMNGFFNEA